MALIAAACGRESQAAAQAECSPTHWVAAWTADPSGLLGSGFNDQTLRIVLTPHIPGGQIRVHISNRFGASPISFAGASIALRQSGAAIVVGSSRPLTFGDQTSVTVPAGGNVVSDPAALTFAAFQDLAVSLYVAGSTGPATGHLIARERSYATATSSGDHAGEAGGAMFIGSSTEVPYVDAVDALAPSNVGAVVVLGDSVTDGYESGGPSGTEEQAGIDANLRYPDDLARRLLAEPGGPRLSVLNAGISGNRLLVDGQQSLFGMSGLNRLDADVLGVAGVTDAIVLEGVNDIANQASADQVEGALSEVVARLHAAGLNVLVGTIPPAGTGLLNLGTVLPGVYVDTPNDAARVAVNGWIRSGASGADHVIDFDAVLRSTSTPNELNPDLASDDHIHPNDAGYSVMAGAVDLGSLRGTGCQAPAAQSAAPAPVTTAAPVRRRTPTKLRLLALALPGGRVRITGGVSAGRHSSCARNVVSVQILHGGRLLFKRRLPLTGGCRLGATLPVGRRGVVEIRSRFDGSSALLPTDARPIFVRTR